MKHEEAIQLLIDSGALMKGHFILTSGLHSDQYIEKFRLLEQPYFCEKFAKSIADYFRKDEPTVVVGPAMGGILLAYEVARQLGVRMAFPERVEGKFMFRRGFNFTEEDRILLVEDVVTTGGSLLEIVEILQELPSKIIGIGLICDRSQGKAKFPVNSFAVCKLDIQTWNSEEIPEWLKAIPAIKPGSRNLKNQ